VANRDRRDRRGRLTATSTAQSKFTLKAHTGKGQVGYDVNSTLIIGERDILLIDPQFSFSEAHKLAAEIFESGKRLATIYSTRPHPDHLFGLAVLKQAFPDAKIVALPATVAAAKTGWPARQKFVGTYGNNIPGPDPVLPEELSTPVLTLEGEEFPITGGVQGSDGAGNSFVWIPSLKTVETRRRGAGARRTGRHARHALDRVDEEVHGRLVRVIRRPPVAPGSRRQRDRSG
jgi:glyoxylase-like metal-dependent hydrolase (beta-lactamase superfamily II)